MKSSICFALDEEHLDGVWVHFFVRLAPFLWHIFDPSNSPRGQMLETEEFSTKWTVERLLCLPNIDQQRNSAFPLRRDEFVEYRLRSQSDLKIALCCRPAVAANGDRPSPAMVQHRSSIARADLIRQTLRLDNFIRGE